MNEWTESGAKEMPDISHEHLFHKREHTTNLMDSLVGSQSEHDRGRFQLVQRDLQSKHKHSKRLHALLLVSVYSPCLYRIYKHHSLC
jgi:hypothetical protein